MIESDAKPKILESLAKSPIVGVACQKAGVSRASYYRWCHDDFSFRQAAKRAKREGRENIADFAEGKLFEKVRDGDFGAIKYVLAHNRSRYNKDYLLPEEVDDGIQESRASYNFEAESQKLIGSLEEMVDNKLGKQESDKH